MKRAYSVLFIGPSSVPFTEEGEDGKLANLTAAQLRALHLQAEWHAEGVMVFQGPGMAVRVRSVFERVKPDVVFVRLATHHLTHEYVLWKLKDRWPGLYPAAKFIDGRMKWLAGGARDHANTPRPWVYTLPRAFASKVVGTSTKLPAEECLESIEESLDYLLAQEDTYTSLWVSRSAFRPKQRDKPEHEQNVALLWKGVLEYAERRRVPIVSSLDMRRHFGLGEDHRRSRAADGIHAALDWREMQARYMAQKTLEALELAAPEGALAPAR